MPKMCASSNTHMIHQPASDISVIWQAAINLYEQNSMTKVNFLSATSVDVERQRNGFQEL
jgi:hypothetical protein